MDLSVNDFSLGKTEGQRRGDRWVDYMYMYILDLIGIALHRRSREIRGRKGQGNS